MKERVCRQNNCGRSLLISFGVSGREGKEEVERILGHISCGNYSSFNNVYLEPQLYERLNIEERPVKFKKATFSRSMFMNVTDAVIRPGLSTIQNLLSSGARIFPIQIGSNEEIDHNCRRIEGMGVGKTVELSSFDEEIANNGHISYSPEDFFIPEREVLSVFNDPENYTYIQ
jgi:hypothetical protein